MYRFYPALKTVSENFSLCDILCLRHEQFSSSTHELQSPAGQMEMFQAVSFDRGLLER